MGRDKPAPSMESCENSAVLRGEHIDTHTSSVSPPLPIISPAKLRWPSKPPLFPFRPVLTPQSSRTLVGRSEVFTLEGCRTRNLRRSSNYCTRSVLSPQRPNHYLAYHPDVQHGALLFRNVDLSPEEQYKFTKVRQMKIGKPPDAYCPDNTLFL